MNQRSSGQGPTPATDAPQSDRTAGLSLEVFAAMSRELAAGGDLAHTLADGHLTLDQWEDAVHTWTERIRMETAVARRFNQLYTRTEPDE